MANNIGNNQDFVLSLDSPVVVNTMKLIYQPAIRLETFFNAGSLSAAFGQKGIGTKINDGGKGAEFYIQKGTLGSVGALADNLTLGKASVLSGGDRFNVKSIGFQGSMAITEVTLLRMDQTEEAFVNLFEDQANILAADLKRSWGRQLYGSYTGVITKIADDTKGATVVLKTIDQTDFVAIEVEDVRKFKMGDIISFDDVTLTNHSNKAAFKIEDIDEMEKEILIPAISHFDSSIKIVAADVALLAKANIYLNNSKGFEMHGLEDQLSDTNFWGLGSGNVAFANGSKRPSYLKPMVSKVTGFITEDVYMAHIDRQEMRSDVIADFLVGSHGTLRSQASIPFPVKRINRDSTQTAANDVKSFGYKTVEFNGDVLYADRYAPTDRLYALNLGTFDMAMLVDLKWDDRDGSIWKQQHADNGAKQLAYSASMYAYKDLVCMNPRANGYIEIADKKVFGGLDVDKVKDATGLTAIHAKEFEPETPGADKVTTDTKVKVSDKKAPVASNKTGSGQDLGKVTK